MKGWVVQTEEDNKVHVRPTRDGQVIDTPVVRIIKPENVGIMTQDNKEQNNNIKNEPIRMHKDFLK